MSVKFTMSFDMDNAAFQDPDGDYADEAARLLRHVAQHVEAYRTGGKILDVNGNHVGSWKIR